MRTCATILALLCLSGPAPADGPRAQAALALARAAHAQRAVRVRCLCRLTGVCVCDVARCACPACARGDVRKGGAAKKKKFHLRPCPPAGAARPVAVYLPPMQFMPPPMPAFRGGFGGGPALRGGGGRGGC